MNAHIGDEELHGGPTGRLDLAGWCPRVALRSTLGFFQCFPTGRLHWAFSISSLREGCPVFSLLREDCTGLFSSLSDGKAALFFHCYGKTALGFFHLFPTGRLPCFFTSSRKTAVDRLFRRRTGSA
jgi:hypothetical protein